MDVVVFSFVGFFFGRFMVGFFRASCALGRGKDVIGFGLFLSN